MEENSFRERRDIEWKGCCTLAHSLSLFLIFLILFVTKDFMFKKGRLECCASQPKHNATVPPPSPFPILYVKVHTPFWFANVWGEWASYVCEFSSSRHSHIIQWGCKFMHLLKRGVLDKLQIYLVNDPLYFCCQLHLFQLPLLPIYGRFWLVCHKCIVMLLGRGWLAAGLQLLFIMYSPYIALCPRIV